MMAYQNNFVVSIIVNSKPVREYNEEGTRVCHIPFDSEFTIRLKNKSRKRAQVKVRIDGTDVTSAGKIILEPQETRDLDRFEGGRRFKFISLAPDPTEKPNELISVDFWPELLASFFVSSPQSQVVVATPPGSSQEVTANYMVSRGPIVEGFPSQQNSDQWLVTEPAPTTLNILLRGPQEKTGPNIVISFKTGRPEVTLGGKVIPATSVTISNGVAQINYPGFEFKTTDFVIE